MASNLSTIGFVFADQSAFVSTLLPLAEQAGGQLVCPPGAYGVWRSRSGAELWFHLQRQADGQTEIQGLTPFFNGETTVDVAITAAHQGPNDSPFEGTLTAWVNPTEAGTDGDYPVVFDAVDFAAFDAGTLPVKRTVHLVGFCRDLRGFVDMEAYEVYCRETGESELRMAAAAFIPVGMFPGSDGEASLATSKAYFTGRIESVAPYINETTNEEFVTAVIETYGMRIDIVADPTVIDGPLQEGGMALVSAQVFGRVTPELRATA
jgi:hypothetical protein